MSADGSLAGSDAIFYSEMLERAREIVLRQLSAGPRSAHQLRQKLKDKDIPDEVSIAVVARYEEVGLVDDEAFACQWVRSRHTHKGLSRSALRRELREKGIDDDLAEIALAQVSDSDEHARALELASRKMRSMSGLPRQVQVQRLAGMLARRGYSPSLAYSVSREVCDSVDEESFCDD